VRELRTNERIRAREVLVITDDGQRLGVMPVMEAIEAARQRDLDLVEVAPGANPPVCRILDYGKFRYEQAKREKTAKHTHAGELREVRFKVKISEHDLDMKVKRAERFLKGGEKVKLSVMFRGRETLHPEIGRELLERVQAQLEENATIEKPPTMEGRFLNMIVGPGKAPAKPKEPREQPAPEPEKQVAEA
jgi:translation initiation factor IF-3